MNWKNIGRALVCLALVCCILVNASPIKAKAAMIEAPLIVSMSSIPVVASIMQGLGLSPALIQQGWEEQSSILYLCNEFLQSIGLCDEFTIEVFGYELNGISVFGVTSRLVEAIRSWLFDSGTVGVVSSVSTSGFSASYIPNSASFVPQCFYKSLYSDNPSNAVSLLVDTINNGDLLVVGVSDGYLQGLMSLNGRLAQVCFPNSAGVIHCSLLGVYTDFIPEIYSGSYLQYDSCPVFLSSSAARAYYGDAWLTSEYIVANIDDLVSCSSDPYGSLIFSGYSRKEASASVEVQSNTSISLSFRSLNYIYDGSQFSGDNHWPKPYYAEPGYITWDTVVADSIVVTPGEDLSLGYVASPEVDLSVGYPEWYKNSLVAVDPNTDEQLTVLPIPQVNSLEDLKGMVQTDIWAGTQVGTNTGTGTGTQVGTGTLAGTNTETFVSSLADAIVTPVVNAITSVFVPSEDFLTAKVEALASKFGFAAALVETVNALKDGLNGVTTEPPVIYLDLGASRGSYPLGGKVAFLDLTWYAEYKPTVDKLISAFLWLCFIWRMFLKLPGIISGMPGDFVAGFAQDMGIMNHLPSRSADLARERVKISQSIWKGRK